jgi:pyruvate,orthophosphate dikinase
MSANDRRVYAFTEGRKEQKDRLGGKGANLAEMTRLGLPVPPGFTVTTAACRAYLEAGEKLPDGLADEVDSALAGLETQTGRRLGDSADPLLVSVRSGAPFSMPGMMDTILNLGLNDDSVQALAALTGDERFAWDVYRRLVQLYGKVVLGVPGHRFDAELNELVAARGGEDELSAEDWRTLTRGFQELTIESVGTAFPQDPKAQLSAAIEAVFRSWNGKRAQDYRRMEGISDSLGTAVNVQAMVFGNLGDDSGTGVAFTRNPSTGEARPYGDWLLRAQGEDVVAGIRVTQPLADLDRAFPDCADQLRTVMSTLEQHYRDMCDIEFTIERGRLHMLQTRVGKRTAAAALQIAVDMVGEGLIDEREAVTRVSPAQLERLLHPQFDASSTYDVLTTGLPASPGAALGAACFSADEAEQRAAAGEKVILVRAETSPEDLHGLIAAQGVLTTRGGLVSHAAVVARGMGKPAVCGADSIEIGTDNDSFSVEGVTVSAGDLIAIDGTTGEVVVGVVDVVTPEPGAAFTTLLSWADQHRKLGVRANADLPEDAVRARALGAEGIGLCRTEHMFLGDRLPAMQDVILAETADEEAAALEQLRQLQQSDFIGLLEAMDGLPVTVRLLDPPLHEFLPHPDKLRAADRDGELDDHGRRLLTAAEQWQEVNPMLGTRGCRLGILKPGLYRMQVRALFQAAAEVIRRGGNPRVEVMIPLVVEPRELDLLVAWVREEAESVVAAEGITLDYEVGTMVETPRAALTAAALAQTASFFSFGTNDLTQMTFGFSRDDVEGRIMPTYESLGLLSDPFRTLDADGVGRLVKFAVDEGKRARPDLVTGVCGEHGGDPASVHLCAALGVDYVSCSPFRIPVARLAAAQAALDMTGSDATA